MNSSVVTGTPVPVMIGAETERPEPVEFASVRIGDKFKVVIGGKTPGCELTKISCGSASCYSAKKGTQINPVPPSQLVVVVVVVPPAPAP